MKLIEFKLDSPLNGSDTISINPDHVQVVRPIQLEDNRCYIYVNSTAYRIAEDYHSVVVRLTYQSNI